MSGKKRSVKRGKGKENYPEVLLGAVCALAVTILLAATAGDLERSARLSESERESVAITFSPPKEEREKGFWDIFLESVSSLLPDGAI